MFKIIIIFFIVQISSCTFIGENQKKFLNNKSTSSLSYSANYLTVNYYLSKGDVYTASEILNTDINNQKLLELKFFSNLVRGNFKLANNISKLLGINSEPNSLFHLPKFILYIKENKFLSSFEILETNNFTQSLNELKPLIELWIMKSKNKHDLNYDEEFSKASIHRLLILENFYKPRSLEVIADKIFKLQNLNNNDLLLLAGFYFRVKNLRKFEHIIRNKLSNQFDKQLLIKKFSIYDNIFYKLPSLHLILASKLYDNSIFDNKNKEISLSYQKILLEMSLYLCPDLDIAKYSLADLYSSEKTYKIALSKLNSIPKNSFFFLASSLKTLSIYKKLDKKEDYKKLLFKYLEQWPTNKFILYKLANFYKSNKQYLLSIKVYRKIIKLYGKNDRNLFLYASNLDKIGKWEDAKLIFLDLLKKNPDDTYTLNYVSYKLALKEENLDFALKLIKKALSLDPENGFFLDTLGWVEFKRQNYHQAVFFLQKSISIIPQSSEILDHLGDCYLKLNRKNEAIYEWKKALKYEKNKKKIQNIQEKLKKYE